MLNIISCCLVPKLHLFWDSMDCSSLDSSVHGISQASILEQVAISFSWNQTQGSNLHLLHWQVDSFSLIHLGSHYSSRLLLLSHFSHVQLCVILWTANCQAPLSMGFSRILEYQSPCHALLLGIFPNQGADLGLLHCRHMLYC